MIRRQPQHPKARVADPLGPEHKRNPIKQSAVPSAKLAKCTRTQLNIFKLTNHAHTPLLSSPGVTQAIIIPKRPIFTLRGKCGRQPSYALIGILGNLYHIVYQKYTKQQVSSTNRSVHIRKSVVVVAHQLREAYAEAA